MLRRLWFMGVSYQKKQTNKQTDKNKKKNSPRRVISKILQKNSWIFGYPTQVQVKFQKPQQRTADGRQSGDPSPGELLEHAQPGWRYHWTDTQEQSSAIWSAPSAFGAKAKWNRPLVMNLRLIRIQVMGWQSNSCLKQIQCSFWAKPIQTWASAIVHPQFLHTIKNH